MNASTRAEGQAQMLNQQDQRLYQMHKNLEGTVNEVREDQSTLAEDNKRTASESSKRMENIESSINDMEKSTASTDTRVTNLESKVSKLSSDINAVKRGTAISMAMSAAPQAVSEDSTAVAVGVASFEGYNGIAASVSHRFEKTTVKFNIGQSGSKSGISAGVSREW